MSNEREYVKVDTIENKVAGVISLYITSTGNMITEDEYLEVLEIFGVSRTAELDKDVNAILNNEIEFLK